MKYLKIPEDEILNLEKARVALYKLLESTGYFKEDELNKTVYLTTVTQPIWHIANKNWEVL